MEVDQVKKAAFVMLSFALLYWVISIVAKSSEIRDESPQPAISLPCEVISVHDGDTLKVECRIEMDIRLLDCWTPEIHGNEKPAGIKSMLNLKKIADGKKGVVHIPLNAVNIGKSTSMSRVLGRLYIDGKDVSDQQVKGGFAATTKAGEQLILDE